MDNNKNDRKYFYEQNKEFGASKQLSRLKQSRLFIIYSLVSYSQLRFNFFYKFLSRNNSSALDLGCGGGNELFTSHSKEITGIDLSYNGCQNARNIYDLSVQGDAISLPFKSNTFDTIVSADLIGHIPGENKDMLLSEINRVLKLKGKAALVIEADGENVLTRFAKKYPDLWQKYHIDFDGHIGLEKPSAVVERLVRNGFRVTKLEKHYGLFYPTAGFLRRFGNEYTEKSVFIKIIAYICSFLEKTRALSLPFNFLIGIIAKPFDAFASLNSFSGLFIIVEKIK